MRPTEPLLTRLFASLLDELPPFEIVEAVIGVHWTALVAETPWGRRCGLASTQTGGHGHQGGTNLAEAGRLESLPGSQVASWIRSDAPLLRTLGMAAINAALPPAAGPFVEENAADLLARLGQDRSVALIGHFPFVDAVRPAVKTLWVLEKDPLPGDLPAERAAEILPQADVVAITGMTLVNHSLGELLPLCRPEAEVLLLGPTAPLSPRLADFGIRWVGGSLVEQIQPVLHCVRQAGTFRQVHKSGVRLVTLHIHP
jgi:uncharacterized protein (DUF4213/DUF364 family)